jgi:hypothetical protein
VITLPVDKPQPDVLAAVIMPIETFTVEPADEKLPAIKMSPARMPRYQPSVKKVEDWSSVDVLVEQ